MTEVRIDKSKLVDIQKNNRSEHRDIFLAAQKSYRQVVIELLDEQLKLAREGKPFLLARIIQLVAPEDHTKDYDRVLRMLELSLDNIVTLSEPEFTNLVQDIWMWSRSWAASNSAYTYSKKLEDINNQ